MRLDYDELRKIYRLEKNSSSLAEVDDNFFDSLEKFFEAEKKAYVQSLGDLSSTRAKSFSNLKKIIMEIFSIREKKLLNKALVASRTGELEASKMASQELETLKEMLSVLNKHQKMLDEILSIKGTAKLPKLGPAEKISLKILQNVPAFMGSDMKEYGPFEQNKTISLPEKIASLLISRKLAEKARGV